MSHDAIHTRLGDLADALTISRGVPTQATAAHGQLPVLSVPDLRVGASAKRFVDHAALEGMPWGVTAEDDVLIALEGAAAGEVFVVPEEFPSFVPSQQVAMIRIQDRSRLDPWYLGAFLSTEAARNQIRRLARGQKVQRISVRDLDTVALPVPRTADQAPYGKSYETYQRGIRAHQMTAQHLATMCATDIEVQFAYLTGSAS